MTIRLSFKVAGHYSHGPIIAVRIDPVAESCVACPVPPSVSEARVDLLCADGCMLVMRRKEENGASSLPAWE